MSFLCAILGRFFLEMDTFVYNFCAVSTGVKMVAIFGIFIIYRKEGKPQPRWQAEMHFWEVFISISLLLSSLDNSMYPRKICTLVYP